MSKAPTGHCQKKGRDVSIWYCVGRCVQRRNPCPELLEATVIGGEEHVSVKCKAQKGEK